MKMNGALPNTYVILIKYPETSARKFCRIPVREKLLVDAQEARLSELSIRTVFPEALVPFSDFFLGD